MNSIGRKLTITAAGPAYATATNNKPAVAANEYVGPVDEIATTVSSNRLSSLARSVPPLSAPPVSGMAGVGAAGSLTRALLCGRALI